MKRVVYVGILEAICSIQMSFGWVIAAIGYMKNVMFTKYRLPLQLICIDHFVSLNRRNLHVKGSFNTLKGPSLGVHHSNFVMAGDKDSLTREKGISW